MKRHDTTPRVRLAALAGVLLMLVSAAVPAGAVSTASASGNIYYTTDNGFTVIDASDGDAPRSGNPFPDDKTVDLPGITLSASGSATVTVDQRKGTYTKLSGISASPDITVDPDDKQAVVLKSGLNSLDFKSVTYDSSNSNTDLTYDAGSTASLTVKGTGLSEGTTVEAIDTGSDATLDSATVGSGGAITFSDLDSGTHDVNLKTQSGGNDDDGGDNGGDSGGGGDGGGLPDPSFGDSDDTTSGDQTSDNQTDGGDQTDDDSSDQTDDGGYTVPDDATVVDPDQTDDGTVQFEVSLSGQSDGSSGDGSESSTEDGSGENTGDSQPETIVLDLSEGGQDDLKQDQSEQDDTSQDDSSQSDSSQDDADQRDTDGGDMENVAVDQLAIRPTEDADPTFQLSVREWSIDTELLDSTEVTGPDASSATRLTAVGVTPRTTENRTDPRVFLEDTGAAPVGYVQVNHTNPDSEIKNVTFQFRVRKAYLNQTGVGPESVALYRDETTRWNELDATKVGENATFYFFEATSPGLSLFTIGSTHPVFEITDTTVPNGNVTAGETVTVKTTVENLGGKAGTHTVNLTAGGEVITSTAVAVTAQSTKTATLSFVPDTAGKYNLSVNGQPLEESTLSVAPSADTGGQNDQQEQTGPNGQDNQQQSDGQDAVGTDSNQQGTGTETGNTGSGGSPVLLFGGLLAALVVVLFAVVYWRRRDDEDDPHA